MTEEECIIKDLSDHLFQQMADAAYRTTALVEHDPASIATIVGFASLRLAATTLMLAAGDDNRDRLQEHMMELLYNLCMKTREEHAKEQEEREAAH